MASVTVGRIPVLAEEGLTKRVGESIAYASFSARLHEDAATLVVTFVRDGLGLNSDQIFAATFLISHQRLLLKLKHS